MSSPTADLTLAMPDVAQIVRVGSRLLVAILIGALIGIQRELTHKPAGLRTHMLVALGTAMVVVTAAEAGMASADLSRIIQGVITGIGFLGGGAILKLTAEHEIHGLTTAAGIWMTAAAAAAAGLGQLGIALLGVVFGLLILGACVKVEKWLGDRVSRDAANRRPPGRP
ncbi:MAG: MgtC/SapB family protein [Gammaproteobacteria bacterium]|nr:MAG: MgtC/SapB family protein [Gammaproteobacteria bacterium]